MGTCREMIIRLKASQVKICRFCDAAPDFREQNGRIYQVCSECGDYKGLISLAEWEEENGPFEF